MSKDRIQFNDDLRKGVQFFSDRAIDAVGKYFEENPDVHPEFDRAENRIIWDAFANPLDASLDSALNHARITITMPGTEDVFKRIIEEDETAFDSVDELEILVEEVVNEDTVDWYLAVIMLEGDFIKNCDGSTGSGNKQDNEHVVYKKFRLSSLQKAAKQKKSLAGLFAQTS